MPDGAVMNIFAYGSNMCTERIRARVSSAAPLTAGHVSRHRLAFHKRGKDGSAKANALYTGCAGDRIWGVVFSVHCAETHILDQYEFAYDRKQVMVVGSRGAMRASIYVARAEVIDGSLKPFAWYHRFVMRGAMQHCLPQDYVHQLEMIGPMADPHGPLPATVHSGSAGCATATRDNPAVASPVPARVPVRFAPRRRRLRRTDGHQ